MQIPRAAGSAAARARSSGPDLETLARLGYLVKGAVYAAVGVLALMASLGYGGQVGGTRSAVGAVSHEPFGQLMLAIAAAGLLAFALWRFTQAVRDTESKGSDAKGLLARAGLAGSGIAYTSLGLFAARLLWTGSGGSSKGAEGWSAQLMSYPLGVWLVAVAGGVLLVVAGRQIYRAATDHFKKHWDTASMSPTQERWATRISRVGISARGLVFVLMGFFLIYAAWSADPNQAKGLGGALRELGRASNLALGFAAAGLLCYGAYCAVNARYRTIQS